MALNGAILTVMPLERGDAIITVTADDGHYPPVSVNFRVLIYPEAHLLADGVFSFGQWASNEPAGTFPEHMIFLQSKINDPDLTTDLDFAYQIPLSDASVPVDADFPYNATSRTRINGLGEDGLSFINTGRGRDLGAALLALDTTGQNNIRVSFTAGTVLPNSRIYALRLQYRLGLDDEWNNVLNNGSPVEYLRHTSAGHSQRFSSVTLPAEAEDQQPLVQLQWRYYYVSGDSGPRAQLRLDDIVVGSVVFTLIYSADPRGTIEGQTTQEVIISDNGVSVTAIPDKGYVFGQWSDGRIDNPRTDFNVTSDINVNATFHLLGDVTDNGKIDLADAILLIRYAAGLTELTELQKRVANTAGHQDDNDVGLADALKLLKILVKAN